MGEYEEGSEPFEISLKCLLSNERKKKAFSGSFLILIWLKYIFTSVENKGGYEFISKWRKGRSSFSGVMYERKKNNIDLIREL